MRYENVLKMPLEPFLSLKCNLESMCRAPDNEVVCKLNLLTLYYAKLFDSEAIFARKIEDTSVVWRAHRSSSFSDVYVEKYLKELFEFMISTLPEWSSFRFEEINLVEVEKVAGITWNEMAGKKRSEKKRLIFSYLKTFGNARARKLFRVFQPVFADSLDYSYGRRVVVFSSERVLKYLNFANEHPEEIKAKFEKEHDKILRALLVIRNLLNDKEQESVLALKQEYMIAVHYGTSSGETHSLGNMNWNVFMAMYILERLLDLADSLFDFQKEEL